MKLELNYRSISMKGQRTPLSSRLSEEMNISGEVVNVTPGYPHSLEGAQNNVHAGYMQLGGVSKKRKPRLTAALDILTALGIREEALGIGQPLQTLLAKEISCSRYFCWAVIDNLAEKILQGLLLSRQDIAKESIKFCIGMIRQVPSGRSLLLQQAYGLKKVHAARGLVLTTEMVLNEAFQIFIAISLSVRIYEFFTTGTSSFSEFETIFEANSNKGVSSMVHFLANFDPGWLYLLLSSPVIAGVLKGLWDTQKSQQLTESDFTELQETVNYHTNSLIKKFYLWSDVLRQMIPMPAFSSVSERIQRAEQQIRWDGRTTNAQRASLFSNIERLALHGSGMSQINAMQSLAKIVHSLSIKDFPKLRQAGYSQETLVQILRIKTQALRDLKMLSDRADIQPEAQQNSEGVLQKSFINRLYANYLLWWLGMNAFKHSLLFWPFKLGKLVFQGLFLKGLVESILEVINCPDKQGFRMFFGDYEIWANELTSDCFREFIRQFRLMDKEEAFQPFLEQLNNFDLRAVESIDLRDKALTSDETRQMLNILHKRAPVIKMLNLSGYNKINDTAGLLFPDALQSLDLSWNGIGIAGAQWIKLPGGLQHLYLHANSIGDAGAQGLKLPDGLQSLDLSLNGIGDAGAQGLKLPGSLQSLNLQGNSIGVAGAQGIMLPIGLKSLDLNGNNIGTGAKGIKLPDSLQSLDLSWNRIGDEGAQGLKLPDGLQSLDLSANNIGAAGAQGLRLPGGLQSLDLSNNQIGAAGAQGLKLPDGLQSLDLSFDTIGDAGAQGLKLPDSLQHLVLTYNNIDAAGAQGLKLPDNLQSLGLSNNQIGTAGAQGLKFTAKLQSLDLSFNNISDVDAQGLKFTANLELLNLEGNNISDAGAQSLKLPARLQSLKLSYSGIGDAGAQGLKLPDSLQSLGLSNNQIGAAGARGILLPSSLQSLDLSYNGIGDAGAQGLKLPDSLQSLDLSNNQIGEAGARGLKLPGSLQSLDLGYNYDIKDAGAQGLKLPDNLQSLGLMNNRIGATGAQGLKLTDNLQFLYLDNNNIGTVGAQGLKLPDSLQSLSLSSNNIGDAGVNALLQKIPKTNLTLIYLVGNPYNYTVINANRTIQQQTLLRNCQDKLCHINTPLWAQQDDFQTSGATRAEPSLFFSWLKKPFDKLSEYASDCISATLDSLGTRLEKVLSQSPSYFPNIHSPVLHDWQPSMSGSVMLHQFNAGGSNRLLLSAPQTVIYSSLNAIV